MHTVETSWSSRRIFLLGPTFFPIPLEAAAILKTSEKLQTQLKSAYANSSEMQMKLLLRLAGIHEHVLSA